MARYTWQRVPEDPPYISRSKVDQALYEIANQANEVLLLVGEKAGSGVTRTSKKFLRDIPESRFSQKQDRLPVLLDLCGGIACLHACELLALVRNSLVRRINLARGITSLGRHLAAFDAFYFIWKADTHRFAAVCQNIKKMIPLRLENCFRPVKSGIALCRVKNKPSVYIISLRIERFACRRFPHQLNSLRSLLRGWKRCSLST